MADEEDPGSAKRILTPFIYASGIALAVGIVLIPLTQLWVAVVQ
jgi:hypothetical protein